MGVYRSSLSGYSSSGVNYISPGNSFNSLSEECMLLAISLAICSHCSSPASGCIILRIYRIILSKSAASLSVMVSVTGCPLDYYYLQKACRKLGDLTQVELAGTQLAWLK